MVFFDFECKVLFDDIERLVHLRASVRVYQIGKLGLTAQLYQLRTKTFTVLRARQNQYIRIQFW